MTTQVSNDKIITAYYDLKHAPITFDFCQFIVGAAAYAKSRNQNSFDLVIVADGFRNLSQREALYTFSERRWRVWNLTLEICKVVPQIRNVSIVRNPPTQIAVNSFPKGYHPIHNSKIPYHLPMIAKAHSAGIDVRVFRPSDYALAAAEKLTAKEGNKYVTITLRKAEYESIRDSRVEEWFKFSRLLKERGYEPIIIPDQDDAIGDETISEYDWRVLNVAAMSVDLRLALYSKAAMNYVTNGGAIGLFIYAEAPFMWYSVVVEGSAVASPKFYRSQGLEEGQKFPWLADGQEMVWEPDTFENLEKSLEKFS